jgi:hypothetical protein
MARCVNTIIDSLNFFVESRNVGNIINVVTTATGGADSGDLVNTNQQGALFFITVASVTVQGADLTVNILAKNISASTYFPWAKMILNQLSAAASTQYMAMLYIGGSGTVVSVGNATVMTTSLAENMEIFPLPVPAVFKVVTSLSLGAVTATSGQTMSYRIDYEKIN